MTPWVRRLLFANIAIFVVQMAEPALTPALILVPAEVLQRPWMVVSYMFLHGGIWHLAFNMIALFFFGPRVEMRLGEGRFLGLYFLSGLGGAALSFAFTPYAHILGASGAIFGVLLAFARYWPREPVYIWGVLPIEARWLVIGMTALALWGGFSGGRGGVAHFAHLGGFAGGFLFLWWMERTSPARAFKKKAKPEAGRGTLASVLAARSDVQRWSRIDPTGLHEVNRQELERLMRKVQSEGVAALTTREREFLERFAQLAAAGEKRPEEGEPDAGGSHPRESHPAESR